MCEEKVCGFKRALGSLKAKPMLLKSVSQLELGVKKLENERNLVFERRVQRLVAHAITHLKLKSSHA